jgi:hypothetical protein
MIMRFYDILIAVAVANRIHGFFQNAICSTEASSLPYSFVLAVVPSRSATKGLAAPADC